MEKIMASDVRADAVLQKACNNDISTFCADVEPGKGRVHECLRNNRDKLSKQCAAEELKLNIIQSSDIRLRPGFKVSIRKICRKNISAIKSTPLLSGLL